MTKSKLVCLVFVLFFSASCNDAPSQKSMSIYPDQQSEEFKQFAKQCSVCHRPPMPDIHPAALWMTTVHRMQRNREKRGLPLMSDMQREQVLAYLQRHAKQDVQP